MEEAPQRPRPLLAGLALAGLLLLAGCKAGPQVRFVGDDRVYTLAEVAENASAMAAGPAAAVKVGDAPQVRQRVLSELRGHGALASRAADFMTQQFPPVTKAVPFYVEAARVDGRPCWVIVEAWGGRSGTLAFRRSWVFDRDTGEVLESRTYR